MLKTRLQGLKPKMNIRASRRGWSPALPSFSAPGQKKCPGPATWTGLGHAEIALRLPQAGPRLPVPASLAGPANRYRMGSSLPWPRVSGAVSEAATSRFRFGRKLHCVALLSELT